MKVSGSGAHFSLTNLELMEFANNMDTILEDGGPKVPSTEDLLSSSISGHVTTTGARVAVIQDSLSFLEG